ncbi:cobalamin biosynthesis protein [Cereibacter sphaeroides]|uniref:cobalamin biosynthesis protein n=1 Tax=Cereibacter sphaeroides TaxID=1063 RepID=UPI003FCE1382
MIVAGLGFRESATEEELAAALGDEAPELLATLEARAALPAFRALALRLGLPVRALPEAALAGVATPTRSARIEERFGTGSIAEAAALVAAGPGATLMRTRRIAGPVTIAVARSAADPDRKGATA